MGREGGEKLGVEVTCSNMLSHALLNQHNQEIIHCVTRHGRCCYGSLGVIILAESGLIHVTARCEFYTMNPPTQA